MIELHLYKNPNLVFTKTKRFIYRKCEKKTKNQNEIGQWKTEELSKALFAKIESTVSQFRQTSVLNLIKAKNPKADLITAFISKNGLNLDIVFQQTPSL